MDGGAAHKIARLSLQDGTTHPRIIEIGGGTGALTKALLDEGADVTVIEIDPDLVSILKSRDDITAAHIVHEDALEFDYAEYAQGGEWHVSANLPYNVATPLMVNLVEMENGPQSLTVMIQKDVADRLAAKPSSPAYGSLSVAIQYAMTVERAFTLGPRVFFPPPNVDSTVVRLVRRPTPAVQPKDLALFRKVVRAAFAYRRKTLVNTLSLALEIPHERVARAVAASNLSPEFRGERLDLADFARLADALAEG